MKNKYKLTNLAKFYLTALLLFVGLATTVQAQNPLFSGADPEIHYFNGKYYIYPTAEAGKRFHAYSSKDLTNWVDEGVVFDIGPGCSWAENNGWAPGLAYKNGKYYFYYTAEVKIGVAVSNSPTGPFVDSGAPLIATDPFTDDIIDAMVFTDDDGQTYIYYGGSGKSKLSVRKLNPDMVSLATASTNITPQDYTEGPYMLKRKGIYYMMYSNGYWGNDSYNVRYSTSNSPMGPWTYRGIILSSNTQDKGPGHHSVIKMGDCDEYYIVYHRYENASSGDRKIAIDPMYFGSDDLIIPISMTNYGVKARIPDNSCTSLAISPVVSGGIYKLKHKGTNQCLAVAGNSSLAGANVLQNTDNGGDEQRWLITLQSDGYFKLTHKGTTQCLQVANGSTQPGADVVQGADIGGDAQRWNLERMTDGYYRITHKGTNQCLAVEQNSSAALANVIQNTDNASDAQRWELVLDTAPIISGGLYRLNHKGTNQVMSVAGDSNSPGANVHQWADSGNVHAQRWYITLESDGYYKLIHKGTNQALDVDNNSPNDGANVHQYTDNGNDAQRWKIELMPDGYYKLTHKGTTKCLDVDNNLAESGTNIQQWADYNNDAQRWKLDLMPDVNAVSGTGSGLSATYYNGMNFQTAALNRTDATVNFDWGFASPGAGVTADLFTVRWKGQVQPKFSGEYTFYVTSNNGRRLWVNNKLIIDGWVDDTSEYRGKINLVAGQKYDIKLEYFENNSAANCKLEWSNFLQFREVIAKEQFYVSTLGINDPQFSREITLANPVERVLHLVSDIDLSEAEVKVFDLQGRVLRNVKQSGNDLDVANLTPGVYVLQVQLNGSEYVKKFIKK